MKVIKIKGLPLIKGNPFQHQHAFYCLIKAADCDVSPSIIFIK